MVTLPRRALSHRSLVGMLACGGTLAVIYPAMGHIAQSVALNVLGVAAASTAAFRSRRSERGDRWVWILLTATLAQWSAGAAAAELVWRAYPSPADALFLSGHLTLLAALLFLGRRLARRADRVAAIDAAIAGVGLAVLAWVGLVNHYADATSHPAWLGVTTIGYALCDVLLVAVLAYVLITRPRMTPALVLLSAGVGCQVAGDVGGSLQGTMHAAAGVLGVGWVVAYSLFAAAALLPAEPPAMPSTRTASLDRVRLGLLGAALAIAPLGFLVRPLDHDDRLVVGGGSAVLWGFVLLSGAAAFRRMDQLRHELEHEHERLAASEERLRLIFDNSPLAISITDENRTLVEINPRALQLTGFTQDEFRTLGIRGVTHPEDVDVDAELFRELVRGERVSFKSMKRFMRKDGGIVWGRVSYSVARHPDGRVRFAIGMVEDVTQQRAAERERDTAFEARRASEDRFRGAFEAGGIGMVITTVDATFVRVNRAFCTITGYAEDELVGRSAVDITHSDDVQLTRAYVEAGPTEASPLTFEKRYVRKDGSVVPVRLTIAVIRDERGTLYHVAHVEDLTREKRLQEARERAELELRQSEERSWTLLAKTLEVLYVIDAEGRFAWVNSATERLLDQPAGELVGARRVDFVHPDDVPAVEATLAAMLAGQQDDALITYRLRRRDGSWRALQTQSINLLADPLVCGVLVSARDVTERAEMERARQDLEFERRVAQRLEAVGQLAAGIAHEINTPIQFVGDSIRFIEDSHHELDQLMTRYRELLVAAGQTDAVAEADEEADLEYLTERLPAAFTRIADGIDRVTSIVRAMQRFARAPQNDRAPADLDEALQATAIVCRNEYKYVADLELDLGGPPPVLCNVGDLNQVFLNLIVNAAHAIAERVGDADARGRIVVGSRVDGDHVVVSVADDGCGIPPGVQERIFEPFFTTKDVGRGTGQGLAISRSIVERHGGSLTLTSVVGEGTTFLVRLPIHGILAEAA